MKPTKNHDALERRYGKLGVEVTQTVTALDGQLVAVGFRCLACGTRFFPSATRQRNRHRCPNGCNKNGGER